MAYGHTVKGGSGDVTFLGQPCLRLTSVADSFLCFLDLSPALSNLPSAWRFTSMDFLASGLQLGLLNRELQQKNEEDGGEGSVPLAFSLWCHQWVATSLHKDLSSFQIATSEHSSLPTGFCSLLHAFRLRSSNSLTAYSSRILHYLL